MYRDSANALDERDRAVGGILISETLVDEIKRAATVIQSSDSALSHQERWRSITGVHDTYPEIWRHLDRARDILAGRGANTLAYDEMRPHARRAPTNGEGNIDPAAVDDARRAIEDLKLAIPGADWKGIAKRTDGLVEGRLARGRHQRTILMAAITMFVLGLVAWGVSIMPHHKISRREAMRRDLTEISQQRKIRIDFARVELGMRCDALRARELTKLLAMDGRMTDALSFGTDYITRCGDDAVVDNWAHAPNPHHATVE
jgi:hypothetical protein